MGFSKIIIVGADGYESDKLNFLNERHEAGWAILNKLWKNNYQNVKIYHLNKKHITIKDTILINNIDSI